MMNTALTSVLNKGKTIMRNQILQLLAFSAASNLQAAPITESTLCSSTIEIVNSRRNEKNLKIDFGTYGDSCRVIDSTGDGSGFLVRTIQGYNAEIRYVVSSQGKGYRVGPGKLYVEPKPRTNGHYNHGRFTPHGVDLIDDSYFDRVNDHWVFVNRLTGVAQDDAGREIKKRIWRPATIEYIGRDLCGNLVEFEGVRDTLSASENLPGIILKVHYHLSNFTGIYAASREDQIRSLEEGISGPERSYCSL